MQPMARALVSADNTAHGFGDVGIFGPLYRGQGASQSAHAADCCGLHQPDQLGGSPHGCLRRLEPPPFENDLLPGHIVLRGTAVSQGTQPLPFARRIPPSGHSFFWIANQQLFGYLDRL